MSNFVKNFPFGKNVWIWELWACVGRNTAADVTSEDIQKLIQKLKDNDVKIALVKCGDGSDTWEQFTPELVAAFHTAGLKIYSWSFVYGQDPLREAAIAMWALDMGADGHVFDAEDQWERLPNPGQAASAMLEAVRAHAPNAVLGYSPEPIIDVHQNFPYVEFGKYCDFVMPQVYWGEWKKTPTDGVNWMFDNWSRWEATWTKNGFGDSIKPIIPVGQAYDDYGLEPNFIVTPAMLSEFIQAVAGYKAVSFWSYQHMIRDDLWTAVREGQLVAPTSDELGLADNPNDQNTQSSATTPAVPENPAPQQPVVDQQPATTTVSTPSGTPAAPSTPTPDAGLPKKVDLPEDGHTTITVKKDPKAPDGLDIKVTHHTPHALLVKQFFTGIFHAFLTLTKLRQNKGGEQK